MRLWREPRSFSVARALARRSSSPQLMLSTFLSLHLLIENGFLKVFDKLLSFLWHWQLIERTRVIYSPSPKFLKKLTAHSPGQNVGRLFGVPIKREYWYFRAPTMCVVGLFNMVIGQKVLWSLGNQNKKKNHENIVVQQKKKILRGLQISIVVINDGKAGPNQSKIRMIITKTAWVTRLGGWQSARLIAGLRAGLLLTPSLKWINFQRTSLYIALFLFISWNL